MVRILALGLLLALAILVTSGNAAKQAPDNKSGWRGEYEGKRIPMDALADLDEVAEQLRKVLDRLVMTGKLEVSGKLEIVGLYENIEEEYMDRWFGDEGKFTVRFKTNNAPRYDREFREQTRSTTTYKPKEAKVQGHDVVLTKDVTGQDHDIVWTVEMAALSKEMADIATKGNGIIVALVDLMNEQAGTAAVPPGNHLMKLATNPGTIGGEAVWFYSVEVRGQSNEWHHNGVFTDEMLSKVSEMKKADSDRDALNAELVQLYDEAGIAHYNPLDIAFNGQYHVRHDCLEHGCEKWAEGQRFPPPGMVESFEYPADK